MLSNTDITLYHRNTRSSVRNDAWKRTYIKEAWWFRNSGGAVDTDGLKNSDNCTVRIWDTSIVIAKDDYIVRGNCEIQMQTVKDLQNNDYMHVTAVNYNMFGDSPHIKTVGT